MSQTWLANKAYDADASVIAVIKTVQGTAIIPSKYHRLQPRFFDNYNSYSSFNDSIILI